MHRFILIFTIVFGVLPLHGQAEEVANIFVQKGHSGAVTALAISKDGQFALSGGTDKKVIYWNVRTGKEIITWDQHTGAITATAISPDGKTALSASFDNTIKIWSLVTGKEIQTLSAFPGVDSAVFSPDGQHVLLGDAAGLLTLLYVPNWHPTFRFNAQSGAIAAVAFSPNGKSVVSGHADATTKHWDSETGEMVRNFSAHQRPL